MDNVKLKTPKLG